MREWYNSFMAQANIFGQNLTRYREQAGWSQVEFQRQLAKAGSDMHMTVIRRLEAGQRSPRLQEALTIAEIFQIPVEVLALDQSANKQLATVTDRLAAMVGALDTLNEASDNVTEARDNLATAVIEAQRAGVPSKLLTEAKEKVRQYDSLNELMHQVNGWDGTY